jgi:exodeoxyribonuclease-3
MRIVSLNINGIKAFYNRLDEDALPSLLRELNPDIIAFQETKATEKDVDYWLSEYVNEYNIFACSNNHKKGYAGVALMIKKGIEPIAVYTQSYKGDNIYYGGRLIAAEFDDFILINVYTLNSGGEKEDYRPEWDRYYIDWVKSINTRNKKLILCGDFNVCYEDIDNYNPVAYFDDYPGMYQFERDGMYQIRTELLVNDIWRDRNPLTQKFTWFSYRGGSYDQNHGWRLDYFLTSPELESRITNCEIRDDLRLSDHHPIILDIV